MQFLLCNQRWIYWKRFLYKNLAEQFELAQENAEMHQSLRKTVGKEKAKKKREQKEKEKLGLADLPKVFVNDGPEVLTDEEDEKEKREREAKTRDEEMLEVQAQVEENGGQEIVNNNAETRSIVQLEQMGFSSNEAGSILERAMAFDVLARVLTSPEGSTLELEIPVMKGGERAIEKQRIELNLDVFRDDKDGETFKALARHFWKDLATHGIEQASKEVGQPPRMLQYSDADGELCLRFMREAGIKSPGVEFVKKGEHAVGKVTVDSGGKNGIFVELNQVGSPGEEKWVVTTRIDHHGEGDDASQSAAEIVYKALVGLGLLEGKAAYEKAVDFLNAIDSGKIPGTITRDEMPNFFRNKFAQSLYGLQEFLTGEDIITFFKMGGKPLEVLIDKQKKAIRTKGFSKVKEGETKVDKWIKKVQEKVDRSVAAIEKLVADGCVLETEKYGRVLVDIGGTVPLTARAAKLMGFEGYINWKPEDMFFMVVADNKIDFEFKDGIRVRNMLIKKDGTELKIGLGDIVKEMTGEKGRVGEGVKNYIEGPKQKEEKGEIVETEKEAEKTKNLVWYEGILDDLKIASFLDKHLSREELNRSKEVMKRLRSKFPNFPLLSQNEGTEGDDIRQRLRAAYEYLKGGQVSPIAREIWGTREQAITFLNSIGIGDHVGVAYLPGSEEGKMAGNTEPVEKTAEKSGVLLSEENPLLQELKGTAEIGKWEAMMAEINALPAKERENKFLILVALARIQRNKRFLDKAVDPDGKIAKFWTEQKSRLADLGVKLV
ncbi:MAG: hypothetical protein ACD_61C00079G0004 [uncultured bacterium]|nr:MAG: hypothetical protein ACD_61C00079G0004 [uncultured bacterium]